MTRRLQRAPWQAPKPAVTVKGSTIDPKLRELVRLRANGCCELCGERLPAHWECHHRKLRSRGGQDSAANLLALDFGCHRRVHGHPKWSESQGFMVASTEDPATEPFALHGRAWRLLTTAGTYRDAESGAIA